MPLLKLRCTKPVAQALLEELSSAVAETIGKPENYVMVVAETADLLMSGKLDDAAYAEIKSIGRLDSTVNHELTMKICALLEDHLGIAPGRIYVTFQSVAADHWGWNSSIFG